MSNPRKLLINIMLTRGGELTEVKNPIAAPRGRPRREDTEGRPYQPSVQDQQFKTARRRARVTAAAYGHRLNYLRTVLDGKVYAETECWVCGWRVEIHTDKSLHGRAISNKCRG